MSGRVLLLIAIVVVGVITAKFVLRARDTSPPAPIATGAPPPAATDRAAHPTAPTSQPALPADPAVAFSDPARPARPALPADPASGSGSGAATAVQPPPAGAAAFAAEARDESWARPTEAEIRKRLDPLGRTLVRSTECRARQCELVLAGSEPALATAFAYLESAKGLQGYARTILLTTPDHAVGSDSLEVRAYAAFDR